ncbi:MAG TPA: phytoene desaturase family protein, partial [Acidimicrobiales bacterium]|nr:phytoene desaturase family protein [Acidimicrobiales bacterium]
MRALVVGAGLGGLSAACHLSGRGHDVTVIERDATPGGRAGTLALGGYRFDTGPTVLTMPSIIESTFAAAGADMADFLALTPVEPIYRATFTDGSALAVRPGREAMAEEVRQVCGGTEARAFERFADWLTDLYALEMPAFIDRDYDSPLDLAGSLRPLLQLARLGGLRKLSSKVAEFFRDDRLQRVFSFQSMYAGLAPYEALALYGVITYMDTIAGVYHADGGAHALGVALASAAEKAGAVLRYDSPVDRVVLRDGRSGAVEGVVLRSGERIAADAVVCNPDLPAVYRT